MCFCGAALSLRVLAHHNDGVRGGVAFSGRNAVWWFWLNERQGQGLAMGDGLLQSVAVKTNTLVGVPDPCLPETYENLMFLQIFPWRSYVLVQYFVKRKPEYTKMPGKQWIPSSKNHEIGWIMSHRFLADLSASLLGSSFFPPDFLGCNYRNTLQICNDLQWFYVLPGES